MVKNAPNILEIEEGVPLTLPQSELSQEVAHSIHKTKKCSVEFPSPINNFSYKINADKYVGQIPIGRELIVRISPKVPVVNVFAMLELAYHLKSFNFYDGIVDSNSLPEIYERLAGILAKRILLRVRKGLFRDYLNDEATLGYVRGRVDIPETTRLLMAGGTAVYCHYQEHTSDLEESQIILWTLQMISKMQFTRPDVINNVRTARRALLGYVTLRKINARECVNRLYNRLNQDYQPMHGLCRFFLESAGPGMEHGAHDFIPFTVNMPNLFETFVAEWLKKNVPDNIKIKPQHRAQLTPDGDLLFQIDLVLLDKKSDTPIAVLDTKYKRSSKPDTGDIEQIVAYAEKMDVNEGYLVYPSRVTNSTPITVGCKTIKCVHFDIGSNLIESGKSLLSEICLK